MSLPFTAYCLTLFLLSCILLSVVAQLIDYYGARPTATWLQQWHDIRWQTLVALFSLVPVTWSMSRLCVRFVTPIIVYHATVSSAMLRVTVRLLAVLPTLVMGNAILTLADLLHITPARTASIALFFTLSFLLMALPTVLNVSTAILKTADRTAFQNAVALGLSEPYAARHVLIPSLRGSLDTAIALAITRIVVEIAVIINTSSLSELRAQGLPREPTELFNTFRAIYGSVTVETNAAAIVLLFAVALVLSSFSLAAGATAHASR